ncbi:MAG: hypothetical protein WC438_01830 [Candidatus Pacearchaeota archaeon]
MAKKKTRKTNNLNIQSKTNSNCGSWCTILLSIAIIVLVWFSDQIWSKAAITVVAAILALKNLRYSCCRTR